MRTHFSIRRPSCQYKALLLYKALAKYINISTGIFSSIRYPLFLLDIYELWKYRQCSVGIRHHLLSDTYTGIWNSINRSCGIFFKLQIYQFYKHAVIFFFFLYSNFNSKRIIFLKNLNFALRNNNNIQHNIKIIASKFGRVLRPRELF